MKKHSVWLLGLAAVLVVGCANQKGPAEQAVAGAETALAAVRDDAQKYVPDRLQAVDAQLAALKDRLAKGDYRAALTGAPTVNSAIRSSGVDSLKSMWSEASNASASGDFTTAVTKAQAVKDKAAEIMRSLGMSAG
ncbi:MAG: hypothetical protein E6K34_12125 [Gammaproteobacteria bacterium]|nr:MAG: hypothetical protein E6K34_12125 [Gammaproteobacteria bacterium]